MTDNDSKLENKILIELQDLISKINMFEILYHIGDDTLEEWTKEWRMKSEILIEFINLLIERKI